MVGTDRLEQRQLSLEKNMSKVNVNKVVVAYSGGLDTSVIIPVAKRELRL
ncbi:hypothetical protein AND4_12946 [Vibrio sp. AND4]|nr:hypothetical protein AND4_12946 [Vibrio sp. AND4]